MASLKRNIIAVFLAGNFVFLIYTLSLGCLWYSRPFYRHEFQKYHISTQVPQAYRITYELLDWGQYFNRDYSVPEIGGLNLKEREHMRDVKVLGHRVLTFVCLLAVLDLLSLVVMRKNRKLLRQVFIETSTIILILAGTIYIFREQAFNFFGNFFIQIHLIFFKEGTWMFGPSDILTDIYVYPLFVDLFSYAGIMSVTAALLIFILFPTNKFINRMTSQWVGKVSVAGRSPHQLEGGE